MVGKVRQKWTKSHKKTTLTHSTQTPPPEKIPNNYVWKLRLTTFSNNKIHFLQIYFGSGNES